MHAVLRGWLGFCGLGAGLVHVAVGVESVLPVGVPLIVIGVVELVWGIFAFTSATLPLPRVVRIAALVPILGWVLVLVLGGSGAVETPRVLPLLLASLLDVLIAIGITWMLRRDPAKAASPLRAGRYLVALAVGALVVSALTIPALAATEAGFAALPHGTGDEPFELVLPGGHGGH